MVCIQALRANLLYEFQNQFKAAKIIFHICNTLAESALSKLEFKQLPKISLVNRKSVLLLHDNTRDLKGSKC